MKCLEHLLGHGEVGDHAVLHRPDGDDVAGRATQHALGLEAHGRDRARATRAAVLADRDHRGLVQDDALPARIDQRVGGAKVDRQIVGKDAAQAFEHGICSRRAEKARYCNNRVWVQQAENRDAVIQFAFSRAPARDLPRNGHRGARAAPQSMIDDTTLDHLGRLARLAIDPAARPRLAADLARILGLFERLKALPLDAGRPAGAPARPVRGAARRHGDRGWPGRCAAGARRRVAGRLLRGAQGDRVTAPVPALARGAGPRAGRRPPGRRRPGRSRAGARIGGAGRPQRIHHPGAGAGPRRRRARAPAARRRDRRPAGRHPVRAQGPVLHPGTGHDLRFAHARRLRAALRRHRGRAARWRRRRVHRQGQHGRVRHGLVERALALRAGAQSLGSGPGPGRLVRRLGRAGGGRRGALRDRLRHRRLGAPARGLLRHHRAQADLWPGVALGHGRLRLQPRPGRRAGALGGRLRAGAVHARRP